ncbi:MAG: cytochrome ubiquinol oxidase subunit I, partial [Streptomyces sp.]|nr:cytochrome ubiquinol oxidase subunit I [Streptomyces sp.]
MTEASQRLEEGTGRASRGAAVPLGRTLLAWASTTDHKVIGRLYMVTSFCFFLLAGLLALGMRAELARPGLQFMNEHTYNQLFTIHGTIMMLLFATPMFAGFANAVMPLQIGAPDVAFPRLNALSYWMYLFGGLMVVSGFVVP